MYELSVLCSEAHPQDQASSTKSAAHQPSIQLRTSPAAACAISTSLVDSILSKGESLPGYQLLGQLALADVKSGSEHVKGVAQHVISSALKVYSTCQFTPPPPSRPRGRPPSSS